MVSKNSILRIFAFPALLVAGFLFWWLLTRDNYFHWDEWGIFSMFREPLLNFIFKPFNEHYIPLNILNHYLLFSLFGLQYAPFQLSVIVFHLLSTSLLFAVIQKLTKRLRISFLFAALFLFQSVANENLVWSQGVNITIAGACLFGAFYFYLKRSDWSLLLLILSPLGHGLTILYPWAFAWLAFWQKRDWKKFVLVGLFNLLIVYYFAHSQIAASVRSQFLPDYQTLPRFIWSGVFFGNFVRFLMPNLYFFPQGASYFGLYLRPILLIFVSITVASGLILVIKSNNGLAAGFLFLRFAPFLFISYLAIAPARLVQGVDQARIARYAYPSFFFLLVIAAIVIKKFRIKSLAVSIIGCTLFVLHLVSLINFETRFWHPLTERNRRFVAEVTYLLLHNDTVLDITAPGINGQVPLSRYWFLFPKEGQPKFIKVGRENLLRTDDFSEDDNTKKIYTRLLGEYQKKYD